MSEITLCFPLKKKCIKHHKDQMRMRRGRLRHAQLTLLARPPNRRMTSLHSLYARRAHGEFCEHAWEGGGSSWPPRPGGAAPRLSQTLLIPHFPRSTFPLKKQPGVTSESAGQARQRLRSYSQALLPNPAWGCSRAHCSQCKLQIQLF